MAHAERDSSNPRLVPGSPEKGDWSGVVEDIEREKKMVKWFQDNLREEHILLGLARYQIERLFTELRLREDVVRETSGRNVTVIQPEMVGLETCCKPHDVRVLLAPQFCLQDEIVLRLMLDRLSQIAKDQGVSVCVPIHPEENHYFYLTCISVVEDLEDP